MFGNFSCKYDFQELLAYCWFCLHIVHITTRCCYTRRSQKQPHSMIEMSGPVKKHSQLDLCQTWSRLALTSSVRRQGKSNELEAGAAFGARCCIRSALTARTGAWWEVPECQQRADWPLNSSRFWFGFEQKFLFQNVLAFRYTSSIDFPANITWGIEWLILWSEEESLHRLIHEQLCVHDGNGELSERITTVILKNNYSRS